MASLDFTRLMTSGNFSDLKLVCQGKEFKIHKLVACSQSSVIATALKGDFKEAQSGIITIEQFDAETVRRMVEYLYTGDYDQIKAKSNAATSVALTTPTTAASTASSTTPSTAASITPSTAFSTTPSTTPSGASSIAPSITSSTTPALLVTNGTLQHVQVNAIADYYEVPGLAQLANRKIQQTYLASWDLNAFVASAKAAINDSGDKSLHNMMALFTAQKLKELLRSGQLPSLVGDFAASVLAYHAHLLEASQREQSQAAVQQQQEAQQQQAQAHVALQQQYNDLLVERQAAEARATRVIENVGKLVSLSNHQECCRSISCGEDFGSYIEATGDPAEPTYILRCSWCHCKHTTN
ncbi:hypothetical protein TRIATDRAFT_315549 [Trichoderma atroviride IMI 206040]|uniref:BTB domain-containing protein n=1 Tax=Hypocrea atroviridis (strain ATCC 20476 / IMI 206040) TaxID=452589 RepID=G9NJZ8_HYPAI|nr:uncharacterized protein TRIATDRAFT_315549 [Trichoderma atroviride IMI 206040]EHK49218.1 hypothetical protein TRIATDRAFT_315549 [Trichoderma atroviride IMI 206040]